ncbi:hypothetical protein BJV82DRAFT_587332 [Fennellomyces sp. T-0311]|nr:hypothetical protein BJV82DRAFT_587332 [Fennellomyces sp. T-0311]
MHRFIRPRRLYSTHAPGFEPPKGSRDTPKIVLKRRNPATSLPSHLAKAEAQPRVAHSAKQAHREQLRQTRHQYAQELLGKYGRREAAAATKRQENEQRMQQEKQALAEERQQQLERKAKIVDMLQLDTKSFVTQDRATQRDSNRKAHESQLREQRRKQLLKLYSSAESFVTLENLDAKIEEALHTQPYSSYHSSLEEYILTSTSESVEIERRKEVIKEAMGV